MTLRIEGATQGEWVDIRFHGEGATVELQYVNDDGQFARGSVTLKSSEWQQFVRFMGPIGDIK